MRRGGASAGSGSLCSDSSGALTSIEPPMSEATNDEDLDGWARNVWKCDMSEQQEAVSYNSPKTRKISSLLRPISLQAPTDLDSAISIYAAPEGYIWRPAVVDTLNFLSYSLGRDWVESGKSGQTMAEFAIFMRNIGCPKVIFVVTRSIADRWLAMPQSDDRDTFLTLWKLESIIIAPSWCSPEQINKITGGYEKALKNFGEDTVRHRKNLLKLNDDLTVVKVAEMIDGIIISKDKFRDQKRYHGRENLEKILAYAVGARVDPVFVLPGCWNLIPAQQCYGGKHVLAFFKPVDILTTGETGQV